MNLSKESSLFDERNL